MKRKTRKNNLNRIAAGLIFCFPKGKFTNGRDNRNVYSTSELIKPKQMQMHKQNAEKIKYRYPYLNASRSNDNRKIV